jgi:hypothetical protein
MGPGIEGPRAVMLPSPLGFTALNHDEQEKSNPVLVLWFGHDSVMVQPLTHLKMEGSPKSIKDSRTNTPRYQVEVWYGDETNGRQDCALDYHRVSGRTQFPVVISAHFGE